MGRLYRKGIEIELTDFPKLQKGRSGRLKTYNIASVFGSFPIIVLEKIPKSEYSKVEGGIEEVIIHEVLHIVIAKIENYMVSNSLDNLIPFMGDMGKIL